MVDYGGVAMTTEYGGRAPASLCAVLELTELNQWAWAGAGSRWDDGGGVAVAIE